MSREFNEQLCEPAEFQDRLLVDTLDLEPTQLPNLYNSFKDLGLTNWFPRITGPYRSLYFLPDKQQNIPFSVRARIYGVPSDDLTKSPIYLSPSNFAVLEIKKKLGDHELSRRQEIKYRQVSKLGKIYQATSLLPQAREILKIDGFNAIPYGYPVNGTIPESVFTELCELGISLKPAFTITSFREHWVADDKNPDRLRVTVDSNYFYHTLFDTGNPYKAINLGTYPWARMEIKVVDPNCCGLAEKIQQSAVEHGGFIPLKRGDAKRAYYWNKFKTISPLLPGPRLQGNELVDNKKIYEMEGKINIPSEANPEEVQTEIYRYFQNQAEGIYGIQKTLPFMRMSTTTARFYGHDDNGGSPEQALVITTNERKPGWIGIKRKDPPIEDFVQFRFEDKQNAPYQGELVPETERLIILDEKKRTGKDMLFTGELVKTKRRLYIENRETLRSYIISIDTCTSGKDKLQQIEIEYGSRQGTYVSTFETARTEAKQDIEEIMKTIIVCLGKSNIEATPTMQTKFEWLMDLRKESHNLS